MHTVKDCARALLDAMDGTTDAYQAEREALRRAIERDDEADAAIVAHINRVAAMVRAEGV